MANSIFGVTELNIYIKNMFKCDYLLQRVSVRGEISNLKYHTSGHVYFSLKDEGGLVSCALFARYRAGLNFLLKEGMQVIVSGNVDLYEKSGIYQIYVKEVKEEGKGSLFEQFEKLKAKLEERGMFSAEYKRAIPGFIKTLGVVTAPTGAAVRDIIDVSKRRNPGIQIILYPAIVQGEQAPQSIIKGIKALENYGVDLIIAGRGGGSMEDLWAFNDEGVCQAIFDCQVPIISAVGHETDFTIADFVSDLRAPTPSAAAELAVSDIRTEINRLKEFRYRLDEGLNNVLSFKKEKLKAYKDKINFLSPENRLNNNRQRLSIIEDKLNLYMENHIKSLKNRLMLSSERLNGLSPLNKLGGGYAYLSDSDGLGIKSVKEVKEGDKIKISLKDGSLLAEVKSISKEGA